ncbi:MAG: hypothetical protein JXQ65_11415 [Candidatus Marinimicrobia bacterium]|nr:hypothetical protein [Candidatus Neomarinimicrobiota bacterium]
MKNELDINSFYRVCEAEKLVYIDIAIDFYREIYNVWDFSPLANRDLDEDLFKYLESCALEIPKKYKLVIVFHIPESIIDEQKQEKSIQGYQNYFKYQLRILTKKKKSATRQIFFYGLLGLFLITSAFFTEQKLEHYLILRFISEGFYVGGWVLFWELFSTIFFRWKEFREEEFVLKQLLNSKIEYVVRKKSHLKPD